MAALSAGGTASGGFGRRLLPEAPVSGGATPTKKTTSMTRTGTTPIVRPRADAFGRRSEFKRRIIDALKDESRIADFLWEGCLSLITQDQKFLLGIHYLEYHDGLNIVPVLNDRMAYFDEYLAFEHEVMAGRSEAERRTT